MRCDTVYYFAYGANLLNASLQSRGIESNEQRRAVLKDYELVFDIEGFPAIASFERTFNLNYYLHSILTSSNGFVSAGYANIRPAKGRIVYGLLHTLKSEDLEILDNLEIIYNRIELTVYAEVKQSGEVQHIHENNHHPVQSYVYIGNIRTPRLPGER